ncbi:hypothetical protein [Streptococcus equi]|nr:hypothetical protein [Streptococcus equi]MDI5947283.1 hypothetical protein [Streptococcus equi subsp. zooepidemicus]HEL0646030.1 hypothetical protein [Streptococcus equi subsp. zooepidemicus]
MEQLKNLTLYYLIILIVVILLLWYFAPSIINAIFEIGKEFGHALAKWF